MGERVVVGEFHADRTVAVAAVPQRVIAVEYRRFRVVRQICCGEVHASGHFVEGHAVNVFHDRRVVRDAALSRVLRERVGDAHAGVGASRDDFLLDVVEDSRQIRRVVGGFVVSAIASVAPVVVCRGVWIVAGDGVHEAVGAAGFVAAEAGLRRIRSREDADAVDLRSARFQRFCGADGTIGDANVESVDCGRHAVGEEYDDFLGILARTLQGGLR